PPTAAVRPSVPSEATDAVAGFAQSAPPTAAVRPSVPGEATDAASEKSPDARVAESVVDSIGRQSMENLRFAEELTQTTPPELAPYFADSAGGRAVVFAALLDSRAKIRIKQLDAMKAVETPQFVESVLRAFATLGKISRIGKLLAAQKAFSQLKTLDLPEYLRFRNGVLKLCAADETLDLFEYTIQASIIRDLDVYFRLTRETPPKYSQFSNVARDYFVVLSHLAVNGSDDPEEIVAAYALGAETFNYDPAKARSFTSDGVTLSDFSVSLNKLSQTEPLLKRKLLTGFWRCVAADGIITEAEGALMCTICAALGVPSPIAQFVNKS
ncbi:MAG: hypothetical protein HUK22_08955, partial [Thermoguttaceae bacterium]|nr:hypothetical protein [Thermoguttaceae bacterium]